MAEPSCKNCIHSSVCLVRRKLVGFCTQHAAGVVQVRHDNARDVQPLRETLLGAMGAACTHYEERKYDD